MGKIAIVGKYKSEIVEYLKEKKIDVKDVVMVCSQSDMPGARGVSNVVVLNAPWYGFVKEKVIADLTGKDQTIKPAAPAVKPKPAVKEEAAPKKVVSKKSTPKKK